MTTIPEPEPEPRLHPLLRRRWSPQVWDVTHEVTTTGTSRPMSAFGRIPPGVEPRAAALPNGRLIARDRRTLADLRWDASRHGHGE